MKSKNSNIDLKRTTIFVNPDLYKKLRVLAIEIEKTVGQCISEAMKDYLKKYKK